MLDVPGWDRHGDELRRKYHFVNFPTAMQFVNRVADLAESAGHHPDIDIRYDNVFLALTTHDAGGLSDNDFQLARRINELETPPA